MMFRSFAKVFVLVAFAAGWVLLMGPSLGTSTEPQDQQSSEVPMQAESPAEPLEEGLYAFDGPNAGSIRRPGQHEPFTESGRAFTAEMGRYHIVFVDTMQKEKRGDDVVITFADGEAPSICVHLRSTIPAQVLPDRIGTRVLSQRVIPEVRAETKVVSVSDDKTTKRFLLIATLVLVRERDGTTFYTLPLSMEYELHAADGKLITKFEP